MLKLSFIFLVLSPVFIQANYANTFPVDTVLYREINKIDNDTMKDFYLKKIYPNPFSPTYNIEFYIPDKRTVNLTLHDSLGTFLANILILELEKGYYIVNWDASHIITGKYGIYGKYFYELSTFDFKQRIELILFY